MGKSRLPLFPRMHHANLIVLLLICGLFYVEGISVCEYLTSCDDCAPRTTECHWCFQNNTCHSLADPYTCPGPWADVNVNGLQCRDNSASKLALILVLAIGGALASFIGIYCWRRRTLKRRLDAERRHAGLEWDKVDSERVAKQVQIHNREKALDMAMRLNDVQPGGGGLEMNPPREGFSTNGEHEGEGGDGGGAEGRSTNSPVVGEVDAAPRAAAASSAAMHPQQRQQQLQQQQQQQQQQHYPQPAIVGRVAGEAGEVIVLDDNFQAPSVVGAPVVSRAASKGLGAGSIKNVPQAPDGDMESPLIVSDEGGFVHVKTHWTCAVCTFSSPIEKDACAMCGTPKAMSDRVEEQKANEARFQEDLLKSKQAQSIAKALSSQKLQQERSKQFVEDQQRALEEAQRSIADKRQADQDRMRAANEAQQRVQSAMGELEAVQQAQQAQQRQASPQHDLFDVQHVSLQSQPLQGEPMMVHPSLLAVPQDESKRGEYGESSFSIPADPGT